MEDRSPTGVLLEMANCADPAAETDFNRWYEEVHVPGMIASGALYEGIRFRNCKPNRTEFQRRIDEAAYLTVYETDWPDVRKAYDAVVRRMDAWRFAGRLHAAYRPTLFTIFRRRPEPGQGHLSEKPINGIFLVLVRGDEDFNRWAKFNHIRYIAQANPPGFTMITRYENAVSQTQGPLLLHLYEMDSDEPERDRAQFTGMVEQLLGPESERFQEWKTHPSLEIWYVNTFQRIGPA